MSAALSAAREPGEADGGHQRAGAVGRPPPPREQPGADERPADEQLDHRDQGPVVLVVAGVKRQRDAAQPEGDAGDGQRQQDGQWTARSLPAHGHAHPRPAVGPARAATPSSSTRRRSARSRSTASAATTQRVGRRQLTVGERVVLGRRRVARARQLQPRVGRRRHRPDAADGRRPRRRRGARRRGRRHRGLPGGEEHGWRLGRVADPFGHHWEIGTPLEEWPPPHGGPSGHH